MKNFQIVFPNHWSSTSETEMMSRDYIDTLKVRVGSQVYPVFFVTTNRLIQEFEDEKKRGEIFWAETNTIIIEKVSLSMITACLEKLDESFFESDEEKRTHRILEEAIK